MEDLASDTLQFLRSFRIMSKRDILKIDRVLNQDALEGKGEIVPDWSYDTAATLLQPEWRDVMQ
jgi:hypothetical protein